MEELESVQYSAARAVTGTWKGTSREKPYIEGEVKVKLRFSAPSAGIAEIE